MAKSGNAYVRRSKCGLCRLTVRDKEVDGVTSDDGVYGHLSCLIWAGKLTKEEAQYNIGILVEKLEERKRNSEELV